MDTPPTVDEIQRTEQNCLFLLMPRQEVIPSDSTSLRVDRDPSAGAICVALAASAGGLKALTVVLAALPETFGATIVVVQHLDPKHPSVVAQILDRRTPLRVVQASEGAQLQAGMVFIAPPARHLVVTPDHRAALLSTAPVHYVRPSADVLFSSVAQVYRERAIAVVLSGSGSDGSGGICQVKELGGAVVVQEAAEFEGMPHAAAQSGCADRIVPLEEIAEVLVTLVAERSVP